MPAVLNHLNKISEKSILIVKEEFHFKEVNHTKNKSVNTKAVIKVGIKIHSLK